MPAKKIKVDKSKKTTKVKTEKSLAKVASAEKIRKPKTYSLVRGMHDILPKEERYWRAIYHRAEELASYFQFNRIKTPVLEEANLFVRSVGRGTDIVDKEMYVFEDRDGSKLALRPEATAAVMRAYLGHGLWNQSQPIKLWLWEPMFRHDRPQAGRYREHTQFGLESLGVKDPAIDAEIVLVAYNLYKDLGINVEVRINSIGVPVERERYLQELVNYYRSKRSYLCEDCRKRITKNPLRLLDCKEQQCQPVKEDAPQIIDWLDSESKDYFMKVLEYLDELMVPYMLTPHLVRGFDYYTGMLFEIYEVGAEERAQSALGGGGRYDLLAETLGGEPAPAVGCGLGIERAVIALKALEQAKPGSVPNQKYEVFFAQLGDDAKRRSLKVVDDLRRSGLKVAYNFGKNALKNQLELANNLAVPYVLIFGQKEVHDGTVIIRDMESGVQETVSQGKLESWLKKKLEKN